jgi:hypothetical protein
MDRAFFCLVGRFDFGTSRAADHTIASAVERQARGRFHFHTFRASAVVDDAVCLRCCMQRPCDISIVDRRLVEDARPFGILSTSSSPMVVMRRPRQFFLRAPSIGVLVALLQRVRACAGLPSHPYHIVAQKQRIPGHTVYPTDLECEDTGKNGRPAYKQRARANGSADEIPVMDTETEKWPIPSKHRDEIDSIKFDFMAYPLRVCRDKTFVEPRDVIGAP